MKNYSPAYLWWWSTRRLCLSTVVRDRIDANAEVLQVLTSFSLSAQVQVVDQEMSLPDVLSNVAVWLPVPSAAMRFHQLYVRPSSYYSPMPHWLLQSS